MYAYETLVTTFFDRCVRKNAKERGKLQRDAVERPCTNESTGLVPALAKFADRSFPGQAKQSEQMGTEGASKAIHSRMLSS